MEANMLKNIQRLADSLTLGNMKRDFNFSNPIPLEQMKGDIQRKGHRIDRVLALDPEARRLFFTDVDSNHLFAEFSDGSQGYSLVRIGFQSEVQKEYDVSDLEPNINLKHDEPYDPKNLDAEPRDRVVNRHDEPDADVSIGARPQGNPNTYAEARPDMTEDKDAPKGDKSDKWPNIDKLKKLFKGG